MRELVNLQAMILIHRRKFVLAGGGLGWKAFQYNHFNDFVSADSFTVPTVRRSLAFGRT